MTHTLQVYPCPREMMDDVVEAIGCGGGVKLVANNGDGGIFPSGFWNSGGYLRFESIEE